MRRRPHRPQAQAERHRPAQGARLGRRRRSCEQFGEYESMLATLEKDHTDGPGRRAARHLPQAAPGRAADARGRADAARQPATSTPSATTWPRSAATRSTRSSASTLPISQGTLTERRHRRDRSSTSCRLHAGETRCRRRERSSRADDIDHFGNRRLRTVGELIQNQVRIGLARMERVVRERMTTQDVEAITPQTLINIRPVVAAHQGVLRHLASCPSSWTRPTRWRADPQAPPVGARPGWSVPRAGRLRGPRRAPVALRPDVPDRDAGRPEHRPDRLAVDATARVNPFGFVETPYRKVDEGKVTDQIDYLTADEEDRHVIAQANAPLTRRRHASPRTACWSAAKGGEVDYVDRRTTWTTWTSRRARWCRSRPR